MVNMGFAFLAGIGIGPTISHLGFSFTDNQILTHTIEVLRREMGGMSLDWNMSATFSRASRLRLNPARHVCQIRRQAGGEFSEDCFARITKANDGLAMLRR
jgi:hypothetical protein